MTVPVPDGLCWPVLRLVNAGHDYDRIKSRWTLPMVLRVNLGMDLQEEANAKAAVRSADVRPNSKGIWG